MINYYLTDSIDDLNDFIALEIKIWGSLEIDAVPVHVLRLCNHIGGAIIVARTTEKLVGLCMGLPAKRNKNWILWSHITGIHPEYQGQGIGYNLKQHQKNWALKNGYTAIGWTFDPLQPQNANFNMNRLGAFAHVYHENFYGEMKDAINSSHSLPSDRLEVYWDLTAETASKADIASNTETENENCYIEIPLNTKDLPLWQPKIRIAFQNAFSEGYIAYRFVREQNRQYYLLKKA